MPTREAWREIRTTQEYAIPLLRDFSGIHERPDFSCGYGHTDDIFLIQKLNYTSFSVSRKKILTITHPSAPILKAAGTGSLHERRPIAFRSDPTLSACCDESQLLLGLPPALLRGSPIEDYPRHNCLPCVWKFGSAVMP